MYCDELDDLYHILIQEKAERGMTDRYFGLVEKIKVHFLKGHEGKPCLDPENRFAA